MSHLPWQASRVFARRLGSALGRLGAFASLTGFSACLGLAGPALDALWVAAVELALAFAVLTGAGAVIEGAAAGGLALALSLAMAD